LSWQVEGRDGHADDMALLSYLMSRQRVVEVSPSFAIPQLCLKEKRHLANLKLKFRGIIGHMLTNVQFSSLPLRLKMSYCTHTIVRCGYACAIWRTIDLANF
jgi:hypothetical protein